MTTDMFHLSQALPGPFPVHDKKYLYEPGVHLRFKIWTPSSFLVYIDNICGLPLKGQTHIFSQNWNWFKICRNGLIPKCAMARQWLFDISHLQRRCTPGSYKYFFPQKQYLFCFEIIISELWIRPPWLWWWRATFHIYIYNLLSSLLLFFKRKLQDMVKRKMTRTKLKMFC
jgi:hypothetical protein